MPTIEQAWERIETIGSHTHKHVPLHPLDPESKTDNRTCMACAHEAAARELALAVHDDLVELALGYFRGISGEYGLDFKQQAARRRARIEALGQGGTDGE